MKQRRQVSMNLMTSFERQIAIRIQDLITGESVENQEPASCTDYRDGLECRLNRASVWRTK
jgi:hypothetical protein